MKLFFGFLIIVVLGALFFLFFMPREVYLGINSETDVKTLENTDDLPTAPEATTPTSSPSVSYTAPSVYSDISEQPKLPNPPAIVKGIYLTGWSAGSVSSVNRLMALIERTELNAVVIDIKDFSGHVSYRTGLPEVEAIGAENELKIVRPNTLIKKLHDSGIYVIGRLTVFQDPILAKAHPEWALINASTSETWTDNKGLAWMDPAAKPVWEYNAAIAKDALDRGFDEINFDYVRFASDGDLRRIEYPFWDKKTLKQTTIREFFKFLRESLKGEKISADLFGLVTINRDGLGIGQVIEDAYKYFDYVSPMVYPSHYASGFIGYKSPAKYPYEVVKYSLEHALARLKDYELRIVSNVTTTTVNVSSSAANANILKSKLRPWFQDFDLGAVYDAAMVKSQIQAVDDLFVGGAKENYFGGWLLWNSRNRYTEGALERE